MTRTINNVPRELLERLAEYAPAGFCAPTALQGFALEARRLLPAPSPAGADGLNTDRNAAFKACPESGCDWGSFYLGWKARGEVDQAIIDGLRGEVERYKTMPDNYCAIGMDANQRIAELEGLLLRVQVSLSLDDTEWGYSDAEKYKLLADIRAALSVGKEKQDEHN